MLARRTAAFCLTSWRAAPSPARLRSAALARFRARFLRNPASRRSCSIFFITHQAFRSSVDRYDRPSVTAAKTHPPSRAEACPDNWLSYPSAGSAETHAKRRPPPPDGVLAAVALRCRFGLSGRWTLTGSPGRSREEPGGGPSCVQRSASRWVLCSGPSAPDVVSSARVEVAGRAHEHRQGADAGTLSP
jgi:hypothetical protein